MLTKTRAIVLNTTRYGEKKIFVNMFSADYGIIAFVYSQPSSGRRGSKMSYMQPLSIVEVEFDKRPMAEIHTIRDIRIDTLLASIPTDAGKLAIAIFLAEFLRFALANEQPNRPLFDFICHSIEWLDTAEEGFANFHIVFCVHLLQFLGFQPNTDDFSAGTWFDLRDGAFTQFIPVHKEVLQPREASLVPLLLRLNFATMHLLRLSRADRNKLMDEILTYYRLHLPHFPELRSFAIVKELFA